MSSARKKRKLKGRKYNRRSYGQVLWERNQLRREAVQERQETELSRALTAVLSMLKETE